MLQYIRIYKLYNIAVLHDDAPRPRPRMSSGLEILLIRAEDEDFTQFCLWIRFTSICLRHTKWPMGNR